jgi:hypothetical protein
MMELEQSNTSNWDLWKMAFRFHFEDHAELLPLFPLLFIPVWTDCFHAVLVRQTIDTGGSVQPLRAIIDTMRLFPSVASTKFRLFFAAILWGFVPIIGWYKELQYRLKWAMASNIHVFENNPEDSPTIRCARLAVLVSDKNRIHALAAIPTILAFVTLALIIFGTAIFQNSIAFWAGGFVIAWILFPASAVVNTLVYLSIASPPSAKELLI